MLKKICPIISLFILSIFISSWGSRGHTVINRKCPESFPTSMVGFQVWADSLEIHASDADNRKNADPNESSRHYIDIDNYAEFISNGRIASTYDSIVAIHGASFVKTNGTLPWATRNAYDSLTLAFKQAKWHKAMLWASDLGHYVADGHMPLHLTANYDGNLTNQNGLHSRYESTMVAAYVTSLSNYSGSSVNFVSNVNSYVFHYIYVNYPYVDSVLKADIDAKTIAGNTNSTQYTQALWSKTAFTTTLFSDGSHALAELIYSAWTEAGKPIFGTNIFPNAIHSTTLSDFSIYPNPTKGTLNLIGDLPILKTEVCDLTGKLLNTFYTRSIDLSYLSNGMYIVSIHGEKGTIKKEKVLIAK